VLDSEVFALAADDDNAPASQIGGGFLSYGLHPYGRERLVRQVRQVLCAAIGPSSA